VKLTARPELAVAESVKGGSLKSLFASAAKLMVWFALFTVKALRHLGRGVVNRVAGLVGVDRARADGKHGHAAARDAADARLSPW
jgi:hypothetical protein